MVPNAEKARPGLRNLRLVQGFINASRGHIITGLRRESGKWNDKALCPLAVHHAYVRE